jgi:dipeptidyl aminopeptidase/acylaminoacyl peptidase
MRSTFLVPWMGLIGVLLPACSSGQRVVPLRIQDVLGATRIADSSPAEFSPDGRWLVYMIANLRAPDGRATAVREYASSGVPGYAEGADICIVNRETLQTKNLTGGIGSSWAPSWSPDGRYVAFLSDRGGGGHARLWVWEASTDGLREVSDVEIRAQALNWLSNSRSILVTALPRSSVPADDSKPTLSSPSDIQAGGEHPKGATVVLYKQVPMLPESGTAPKADAWSFDGYLRDLAMIDVTSGVVNRLVTRQRVGTYVSSPDGSYVAFSSPRQFEKPGSQQILWELNVISIATGEERTVASGIRLLYGSAFSWSPNRPQLCYSAFGSEEKFDNSYVVDVSGGSPRNITMFRKEAPHVLARYRQDFRPLWSADGKFVYVIRGGTIWKAYTSQPKAIELAQIPGRRMVELVPRGGNCAWSPDGGQTAVVLTFESSEKQFGFYRIQLETGQAAKLVEGHHCYTCENLGQYVFGAPTGDAIAYFSQDALHDGDLWVSDSLFHTSRRLTHLNPQLDDYQMGVSQLLEWSGLDGDKLQGTLLLPAGYQAGHRYPLIVWVYGSEPMSDDLNRFGLVSGNSVFNFQLLATRGYAVLLPDAPQHLGTPMLDLVKTVLPGVNRVVEMGIADPDRLGVMGHSNGGYSTLALIVQTTRFKSAIEADGTGDLVAEYGELDQSGAAFGTSNLEQGQDGLGGTPWEVRERYIENSPLYYLDRVETPLLIVHGDEDRTVAPFLGDELFVGLRRLGKKVELAKYGGEGHSPLYWSYANQVDVFNRMIAWFDEYLVGASPPSGQ